MSEMCYSEASNYMTPQNEERKHLIDTKDIEMWKKIFKKFKEVDVFLHPVYKTILNDPLFSTANLYEEKGCFNTQFVDLENLTYFYDFSKVDLIEFSNLSEEQKRKLGIYTSCMEDESLYNKGVLLFSGGSKINTIGEKLNELTQDNKKVTHIVLGHEMYGGNTHYSTWCEYLRAEIFEIGDEK